MGRERGSGLFWRGQLGRGSNAKYIALKLARDGGGLWVAERLESFVDWDRRE